MNGRAALEQAIHTGQIMSRLLLNPFTVENLTPEEMAARAQRMAVAEQITGLRAALSET